MTTVIAFNDPCLWIKTLRVVCIFLFYYCIPAFSTDLNLREEDSLIVQVKYQDHVLTDAIFIYVQQDYVLVPLGELMIALEFPITVDVERDIASGWFLSEAQTFNANFSNKSLFIRGQRINLPEPLLITNDGFDLFVSVDYLKDWFGIQANFLHSQLVLDIKTSDPLPIADRLAREKKRDSIGKLTSSVESIPTVPNTYQAISQPGFDAQLTLNKTQENASLLYNLQGAGDILFHESRYQISGNEASGLETARVSFAKRGHTPVDTLWLGSHFYEFGDILSSTDPLILSAIGGLGAKVIRGSEVQADAFSNYIFEGDGQPGWEAELYRNGILVDFQIIPSNGRYIFEDVELIFGENIFDIIQYGPQGQKRTRRETIRVGEQMIQPGAFTYRLNYLNAQQSVFNISEPSDALDAPSPVYEWQTHYGMSVSQTLGLGLYRLNPTDANAQPSLYKRLTLNSAWPWLTTSISLARQNSEGSALHALGIGRVSDFNWTAELKNFNNFLSQPSEFGRLRQEQHLSLDSTYSSKTGRSLRYKIDLTRRALRTDTQYVLEASTSTRFGRLRLVNELRANYSPNTDMQTTQGRINLHRSVSAKRIRAILNYTLAPEIEMSDLNLTYDYLQSHTIRYQVFSNLGLAAEATQSIGASLSKQYDAMIISLNAEIDSDHNFLAFIKFDFGFQLASDHPFMKITQPGQVDHGIVHSRVFLDNDFNQQWSDGDEPLSNIGFLGRKQWESIRTDAQGQAQLGFFDAQQATRLRLNQLTLGDPYLHSSNPEVMVYTHAGGVSQLDFPIVLTTEIEGTVLLKRSGSTRPGSGIALLLKNPEGNVIAKTRAEFDGFYFFTGIPPGKYIIGIDTNTSNQGSFESNQVHITASTETGVVYADDLIVEAITEH